ncbi:DUF2894 domain-containing protein [Paraburkholderia sp. B3]|uniref:DUF2894 domain-containing protein n=1 Tax=Paraburkholderia sp. B3 TaxID=3134791 RepID=UPI00398222F2
MSERSTPPLPTQLDAWRERGADRLDPARFRAMEALALRAARHGGEVRRLLDARLSELMTDYAALAAGAAQVRHGPDEAPASLQSARGALGELVDYLANQPRDAGGAGARDANGPSVSPELLDYFRATWARVRTGQQLRVAEVLVPQNAGPLNSSSLVHRALSLMRELSPGYLQQFLTYADALSWLEQLNAGSTAPGKEPPRAASAKKGTRGKAR